MTSNHKQQALYFHRRLPSWLWEVLRGYGLSDSLIHARLIGWDGEHVAIPIFSWDRRVLGFEFAELCDDGRLREVVERGPKTPLLYGEHLLWSEPEEVVIAEGVVESLILSGQGFSALSATGDGFSFRREWASSLGRVPKVSICFRRRDESIRAALAIRELVPHARIVTLPPEVYEGGLCEFFLELGARAEDLRALLNRASGNDHGRE